MSYAYNYDSSKTIYAKPLPISASPSWGADVITFTPDAFDTHFSDAALNDATAYKIFEQAGGSPASTDEPGDLIPAVGSSGGSGGSGSGDGRISFDAGGIKGVKVSIVGTNDSNVTDLFGVTWLNVPHSDPAVNYTIRITPPTGYQPVDDIVVPVGLTDPAVQTITLTEISLEAADAPFSNVEMPVVDQFGVPRAKVAVTFEFVGYAAGADKTAVVVNRQKRTTSNGSGTAMVTLLRLGIYNVSYTVQGTPTKRFKVTIPDAGSHTIVEP
jgi:hypothetical protein